MLQEVLIIEKKKKMKKFPLNSLHRKTRRCSRFASGRLTYVQNERATRHSVHGFVEESCGRRRSHLTASPLIAILINVEAGHSFHSILTFQ